MILTTLLDLQLWLLFEGIMGVILYSLYGRAGLFGGFVGSFIYLVIK